MNLEYFGLYLDLFDGAATSLSNRSLEEGVFCGFVSSDGVIVLKFNSVRFLSQGEFIKARLVNNPANE